MKKFIILIAFVFGFAFSMNAQYAYSNSNGYTYSGGLDMVQQGMVTQCIGGCLTLAGGTMIAIDQNETNWSMAGAIVGIGGIITSVVGYIQTISGCCQTTKVTRNGIVINLERSKYESRNNRQPESAISREEDIAKQVHKYNAYKNQIKANEALLHTIDKTVDGGEEHYNIILEQTRILKESNKAIRTLLWNKYGFMLEE